VSGVPFGLFYNSYDLSSKAFCLAWFLATSWYLTTNITRSKIRNYFRIQTSFDKATHIQIEKERKVIQMMSQDGDSSSTQALKKLENVTRQLLGFDVLVKTVPVLENNQHRYFEFQSTRYNFDLMTHSFKPAIIDISLNPSDLLKMDRGLGSQTAQSRLETLGPNFIQVKVPSFLKAFWQE
jgi:hypothetical protein